MDDQLGDLVGEDGVGHVPEVLSLALAAFRISIREIRLEFVVLEHDRVHSFNRYLVELPELDVLNLLLAEEVLVTSKDRLHVVLGHLILGQDVELLQQNKE